MKAVVVIERATFYRLLAPVVDAALARGWDVECWHDYGQPADGLKGYQFPSVETAPLFQHGRPALRSYQGAEALGAWLRTTTADVVISLSALRPSGDRPPGSSSPLLVGLQSVLDTILRDGPDGLRSYDVLAAYSEWWLEWAGAHFETRRLVADGRAYVHKLRRRTTFVGLPAIDGAINIDPDEVRRRWEIPERQPVVVLFPFPQGVGRNRFWAQGLFSEPSRVKQTFNLLKQRRFEYWSHVRHGWNDANLVKALRRFCDRNGAYLLVKSRRKTPIPEYLRAVADRCLYDEGYYPSTTYEALRIASLSISYYSSAVLESVALGVPHVCVPLSLDDYVGDHPARAGFARFYTTEEGSPFQWRGVSTAVAIPDVIDRMPTRALDEFVMDGPARARYLEKFLTHVEGGGAERTLRAIEQRLVAHAGS